MLALLATVLRQVLGDYPRVALLAVATGLNNATANRLNVPRETTTGAVTSTLTTLGAAAAIGDGVCVAVLGTAAYVLTLSPPLSNSVRRPR
jgi:hypothetical protein